MGGKGIALADVFTSELAYEDALVEVLEKDYGWRNGTLNHPSEQDLLDNWAQILFENNKGIDRLNSQPLTQGEMAQIVEQIVELRTPMRLNGFINGKKMLTGFDSKWVNTLYLDKVLEYEHLIQAFSRTNRLFGPEKPFGTMRYYRHPHTMEQNVRNAVGLYSGDRPMGLFASKLEDNLRWANDVYAQIRSLFVAAGIEDFGRLPETDAARAKFAKLFKELTDTLEASKIQGFAWGEGTYEFGHADGPAVVTLGFDENTYLVLALRDEELFVSVDVDGGNDVPYDIHGYLTEIDTGHIDTAYMNANFDKWLKRLAAGGDADDADAMLDELHGSFATLD